MVEEPDIEEIAAEQAELQAEERVADTVKVAEWFDIYDDTKPSSEVLQDQIAPLEEKLALFCDRKRSPMLLPKPRMRYLERLTSTLSTAHLRTRSWPMRLSMLSCRPRNRRSIK